jgi:aryl-alcohol dehydrogenase-like predicted oxidoreductase
LRGEGARFVRRVLRDDVLAAIQQLVPLAQEENLTMTHFAVAWVLQNGNVASAITGGSHPDQVTSNGAAAGRKLSPETMAGIDSALGSFHRE